MESNKKIEVPIRAPYIIKYHLIPVKNKNIRPLFPGYKIPFTLKTDIGKVEVYITSAQSKNIKKGSPTEGRYIKSPKIGRKSGLLNKWFDEHDDLKIGDKLVINIKKPNELYELDIKKGV